MTKNDRYKMARKMIQLTIDEMSHTDMLDFIDSRLWEDFDRWNNKDLVEHYQMCWPEDFKNFEFEQNS